MLRRSIISMAGVMPLTMAFPSRAQVPTRVHRIGFLSPNARESPTSKATLEEFLAFLQTLGYAEGRNLIADVRYAEGQTDRLAALAAELAALKPDVIVALTTQGTLAARRAAPTTAIVMINVTDPVGVGLVASLARPGGNVTGVTDFGLELCSKSVELARAVVPLMKRIAVLTSDNPVHQYQLAEVQKAALKLDLSAIQTSALTADDLERAISFAKANASALIVLGGGVQSGNREKIAELTKREKMPAFSNVRPYVDAGLLASYGPTVLPQYRIAATYVRKIFAGTQVSDLPVEQPTHFELVVNLKTAKALGIKIPQSVMLQATEVIE